ncbi:MAG: DMT family transporter [Deltaproteobacteria bacterium]|nr:DMT family transporter [Deltaproteobacteria bacterium]
MLSFSLMSALVKLASAEVSSAQSVFVRGVVGVIWVFMVARYKNVKLRGNRKGLLALRALAGTIALILVFYAFTKIPTANAMLLNQAVPVFMVPLAVLFLKEKTSFLHVVLIIVALLGATLVLKPDMNQFNVPGYLALLSALFAAIAYLLVRKLNETEHPLTIVFWFVTISTLAVVPWVWADFVVPSLKVGLQLLMIGVLGTLGQIFLTLGYKFGDAGRLAVIGSMGAVFCALWDFLLWRHIPDVLTAIGGIVVIGACAAIQVMRHHQNKT